MTTQAASTETPIAASAAPENPTPSPTGDAGAEGQEKGEQGQRPRKDGAQRAIDRQTRKFYEERAQRIALEKELERYRAGGDQGGKKPAPSAPSADTEPNPDDFTDPKEFTKAVARFEARQALKEEARKTETGKHASRAQEADEAFAEREDAYREASETYDDAVDSLRDAKVRFNPTAIEFIQDIDKGPALLEHLGNNLKEAKRIADLSPVRQIAELTRIADKLPAAKPEEKKKSGAPEPVEPVRNRASVEKSRDELSDDEWVKRRRAERAKKK